MQLVFAGKAHPMDNPGKELIRQLIHLAGMDEFRKKIVFVEDYNIEVARYLVQGVDIWLNTPRRPLEASGTSGMKVPPNGGVNLSVLDGWWCEGYRQDNGWAIGAGEDYEDQEYQDEVESTALYELLENEIVPVFYDRSSDDVPREWTRIMKNSMRTVNAEFNTNRMLEEYSGRFYVPCVENARRLGNDGYAKARELAAWRSGVARAWPGLKILCVEEAPAAAQPMGSTMKVQALVEMGGLSAEEVLVEVYHGPLDVNGEITGGDTTTMVPGERRSDGLVFEGAIPCTRAGRRGYTVRAVPRKEGFPLGRFETGLVAWWDDPERKPCDDHAAGRVTQKS